MNMHVEMPREVNKVFAGQSLDPRGGGLDPLNPPRPVRYFGLPMVNPSMPPLPPNKPYHRALKYPKYVKDSHLNAHVRIFKTTIKTNGEIEDVKLLICLVLLLKILCLTSVTITWEIT
jgi:hypothetical protein